MEMYFVANTPQLWCYWLVRVIVIFAEASLSQSSPPLRVLHSSTSSNQRKCNWRALLIPTFVFRAEHFVYPIHSNHPYARHYGQMGTGNASPVVIVCFWTLVA